MKTFCILLFAIVSLSAMAADVQETIAKIETENNVLCEQTSRSKGFCIFNGVKFEDESLLMGGSIGNSYTCRYSVRFSCKSVGNGEDLELKLKVKEKEKERTRSIISSQVTKIIYYR